MKLHQLFLTNNNCYKSGRKQVVKGIMVHSTGVNNPKLSRYVGPDDGILGVNPYGNHWNQPKPDGRSVCVHAFIGLDKNGDIRTYQTLPWDMVGWHSGSGKKGSANTLGYIGFEICEGNFNDGNYLNKVYKEAVELCVYLCKMYNLTEQDIIDHSEGYKLGIASNHGDVRHWFSRHSKSMDGFRMDVRKELRKGVVSVNKPIPNKLVDNQPSPWAKEYWDQAKKDGVTDGTRPKDTATREEIITMIYRAKKVK